MRTHILNSIIHRSLQRFDIDREWLMLSFKTTFASLVALFIANITASTQSFFLVLATIFFIFNNPDNTKKQQLTSTLFAGFLSAIGVFLATITSHHLLLLLLVTIIFTSIGFYAARFGQHNGIAGLFALILVITAGGLPGNINIAYERLNDCLLGLVIALAINFLIFPQRPFKKLKYNLVLLQQQLTDYFYHTYADCLRGNRINTCNWQIKERIFITLSKNRHLLQDCTISFNRKETLEKLFIAQEKVLEALFPLTNLLTNPANNAAFINILPDLAQFCSNTQQLLGTYTDYLQKMAALPDHKNFLQTADILQIKIANMIDDTLQKEVMYYWPFDLGVFSYLLSNFLDKLAGLRTTIQDF